MVPRVAAVLCLVALCAPALAPPAAAGGVYDPPFPKEEFAERRARFFEQVDDGVAVFLGAQPRADYLGFRQNNTFHYLTGVETPGAVLLLDGSSKRSTLFVPRFSDNEIRAEGPQLEPGDEAAELTGLDRVAPLEELTGTLLAMLTFRTLFTGESPKVYVSMLPEELPAADQAIRSFLAAQLPWDGRLSREMQLVAWLRDRLPIVEVATHDSAIHALRRIKTRREVEAMRAAGRLTAEAVNEAIRATRPGRYEYQVSAAAEFVIKNGGAQRLAWDNIVASGANGNTWHYFANDAEMAAGDLVLIDAGAELDYYAADLTRTWPVSGRFTPEQEAMYRCVLEAREKAIAAVRPGVTAHELAEISRAVFEEHGLADHTTRGIGHLIGMSPHDVGSPMEPFEPGVVFNVEPILDIPEQGIHIRLEDTVLVTEDGHEVFTAASPVTLEEIYRLYDQGSRLVQ